MEQAAVKIEKCRDDDKVVLETKERERNDEHRILIKKIENCTTKCAIAQAEIEEYREDAKSLREGFDKAKIDIDKYRDDAERVLITKEREWNDKQRISEEQIKDLSDKLSLAQNDERKERALMEEDNELQWREERECLLMEIKLLKENMAAGLDSNQSMTLWGTLTEHNLVIFHDNNVSAFVNVFMVCIDVSSLPLVPTVKPITPKSDPWLP